MSNNNNINENNKRLKEDSDNNESPPSKKSKLSNFVSTGNLANVMVYNPVEIKNWYVDILDCEVVSEIGDLYVTVQTQNGFQIGLCKWCEGSSKPGSKGPYSVCFIVNDMDEACNHLKANNVKIDVRVKNDQAKMELAFFQDPDGNVLYFSKILKEDNDNACPGNQDVELDLTMEIKDDIQEITILGIREVMPRNSDIGKWFGQTLPACFAFGAQNDMPSVGSPLAIYHCNDNDTIFDVAAVIIKFSILSF
eukprot:TRINITY_DN579_c0_g1_i2.p1 TRINITY_DN579_c0_g1~~TRINITY_DN579_c0_g1_i2.p1  ORF type:complete len:251 (-),score=81.12 TRINITY_DN579_c0_g1_i2:404-1156(-)